MIYNGIDIEDACHVVAHLRDDDRLEIGAAFYGIQDFLRSVLVSTPQGWTGRARDGEAVAIGGVTVVAPGVGQAWMVATDRFAEIRIAASRAARQILRGILEAGHIHRLQTYSLADRTDAHLWLIAMGFDRDPPLLQSYGLDRQDFLLFSMIAPAVERPVAHVVNL